MNIYLKPLIILFIIVPVIILVIYLLKKLTTLSSKENNHMNIVAQKIIGAKEKLLIVEIEDIHLLLGVSGNHINKLYEWKKKAPNTS